MDTRKIIKASLDEVPQLYASFIKPYFPENERKPLKSIMEMIDKGLYCVFILKVEGRTLAAAFITTYSKDKESYLLDYLAVAEDERCKNYGGYLLKGLKEMVDGKPILIETESIDAAENETELKERERRNRFYLNNGAKKTGITTCIWGAVYSIWTLSETKTDDEWVINQLREIYHFMIPKNNVYEKMVEIPF